MNKMMLLVAVLGVCPVLSAAECKPSANCDMLLEMPREREIQFLPVTAKNNLEIGSGVTVLKADSEPASVASIDGDVTIASGSKVGNVYAGEKLTVDLAVELGEKVYATDVVRLNKTKLPEDYAFPEESPRSVYWSVTFNGGKAKEVKVAKGGKHVLEPARYGAVTIAEDAELTLKTGTYYFDALDVNKKAKIVVKNKEGTVVVYVRETLKFSGKVLSEMGRSDLLIGYLGDSSVLVKAPIDASVIAPNAKLEFSAAEKKSAFDHYGMFFAKDISILNNNHIYLTPVSRKGPAYAELMAMMGGGTTERDVAYIDASTQLKTPFANSPLGQQLRDHLMLMYAYGDDAQAKYEESLEALRKDAEKVVGALYDEYQSLPVTLETQDVRWSLVQVMGEVGTEHALEPLQKIIESPIDVVKTPGVYSTDPEHPIDYDKMEHMIRARAVDGVSNIAGQGVAGADSVLLDNVLSEDSMLQAYAVNGYLSSGNVEDKRAQLSQILGPNQQHLLDMEKDVTKVDTIDMSQVVASDMEQALSPDFNNAKDRGLEETTSDAPLNSEHDH